MVPPTVADVAIGTGVTLSYATLGGPGEPMVFLPGPTDSWRSYRPVLERLSPSAPAVAVSLRGHGDSDKPASGYGVADFAADVVAFLDALGIERAILVGHSGSSLVARRVALDHPRRVAGLVLEASPTTLKGNPNLDAFVGSVLPGLHDPIDPSFARSFLTETSSDRLSASFVDELVAELLKVPARVWRQMFAGLQRYDDTAEIGRLRVPTLLVWGDRDNLVTRAMHDDLARRIPAAQSRVYEGAGHTPRWEDPTGFSNDLMAFAAGVAPAER